MGGGGSFPFCFCGAGPSKRALVELDLLADKQRICSHREARTPTMWTPWGGPGGGGGGSQGRVKEG